MHIIQRLLVLAAVSVGLVAAGPLPPEEDLNTWDVAVTRGLQIEFYKNKVSVDKVGTDFSDLTELTYDPVSNMLLFVGQRQGDDASVFGYDIAAKKFKSMGKTSSERKNIKSLAYDPVKEKLFWIDINEKSICWTSVESATITTQSKNVLFQSNGDVPQSIAIDSCRGYIYWTNTGSSPTIERARYDGTEREVLINTDAAPYSIALDQQTKRIYWFQPGFVLLSADLEGKNVSTLLASWGHETNKLSLSKDSIYLQDNACYLVWKLPKQPTPGVQPEQFVSNTGNIFSIAANYQIKDQTEGHSDCQALTILVENNSTDTLCVHGTEVNDTKICECEPGYTGERCDISVCTNFCISGNCTVSENGLPKCSCMRGYSGDRCDVSVCYNYCLNSGTCTLDEENTPVCQCADNFNGLRCEHVKEDCSSKKRSCCKCCGNSDDQMNNCCEKHKNLKMFYMESNE